LVARQPHEKSKIGHNLLYIIDRLIILGSTPPFSTNSKLIMTPEGRFNNNLTCKLPIYAFDMFSTALFLAIKGPKSKFLA
jgi:hypothetical protein